ncbi:MAG: DNA polymerase III subunit alpha, partial [Thermoleophilaceae bacterium]|nr:DNA polymerase III subunit alpha [Thermoleophilaceae bacterium]
FDTNEFFLKSSEEMAEAFGQWPEAVPTSLEIAERCDVEMELGKMLIPSYEAPEGVPEGEYLRRLAEEGLRRRYGDPPPAEAVERLNMELEVIGRMGFDAYFLIVWDFVKYAKDNGIAVGPGRGSAAGSIVSYSLDITEVDPLAYGLLFERFLNPERVSMPDIDIDFSVRGRDQVMRYVADKYGRESVAQIVTFGKMLPRNATRDAARVLGFDYGTGDRLAKFIPEPVMGRSKSFDAYLKEEPELKRAYDTEPESRQVIDTAMGLEGIVRNAGIHAAAVVIADRPLTDLVPLQLMEDRGAAVDGERAFRTVTQYSMKPIEEIGLLKMDFLGLRNLDVIEDCLDILERSSGERLDMTALPLDDAKTYEMMARGESVGVFQFESDGMREALRKVKPSEFEDLVALVALYRPGAMKFIDTYARNKRFPDGVTYVDDRLRPLTESTYSVILYQEQVMQIAKTVAGFSGAEADDLRKAIGKKNREAMAKMKPRFFEGARASGTAESVIDHLWAVNEANADYSFNRSHAACYALISYRTAWLRANHPAEYMAALISSVMSTKDKVPFFVSCCEEMSIEVLPPDVNECGHRFVVSGRNVRFGLDAVKGVGAAAVDAIIEAREEYGRFLSIWDFCKRVDCRCVNRKAIEALVKCGALDSTGATRTGMLSVLEQAQGAGNKSQQDALMGQSSIFDLGEPVASGGGSPAQEPDLPVPALPDERAQLNVWEKETLGLFLSSHPLKEVRPALRAAAQFSIAELAQRKDGEQVTVGGMITECKQIRTRKGEPMAFATLDDLEGSVELVVFATALAAAGGDVVATDRVVMVTGRVEQKEAGEIKLVAQDVKAFEPTPEEVVAAEALAAAAPIRRRVTIDVQPGVPGSFLEDLKDVCRNHPGEHELVLVVGRRTL